MLWRLCLYERTAVLHKHSLSVHAAHIQQAKLWDVYSKIIKRRKKLMKRKFTIIATVLFLIMSSVVQSHGAQQKEVTFKFAHYLPLNHFSHIAAQQIVDEIKKNGKGTIRVNFYPAEQLYKSTDLHEAVRKGNLEMGYGATSYFSDIDVATSLFDVPFLFSNFSEVFKAVDGGMGKKYDELLNRYGVKVIGYMHYGFLDGVGNNVRPIKNPEDMKGLRIRTFGYLSMETFKALGASPTAISSGETYTAIQRGTVDGGQTGISSFVSRKWFEVLKYTTVLPMSYVLYPMMVNLKWWNSVPPESQKIIVNAVQNGVTYTKKAAQEETEKCIKILQDKGVQVYVVPAENLKQWRAITKPVWDIYLQKGGKEAKGLIDLAEKAR
jgi:tripartite ATP-independent transporter DctP family solute receptor